MKKIVLCILLVVLAILLTGCSEPQVETTELGWSIVQSPVTGRYYEVTSYTAGPTAVLAMSEVSKAEYEAYLRWKAYNQ